MIPRGTTPTIKYSFKSVRVNDLAVAYMTLRQGALLIEKNLSEAEVNDTDNTVGWRLTQAETLSISDANVEIQCRWKLADGTAGTSLVSNVPSYQILKDGEI